MIKKIAALITIIVFALCNTLIIPAKTHSKRNKPIQQLMVQPADEIKLDDSEYNEEAMYYQYCLKALGYTGSNGKQIDVHSFFTDSSKDALNKFLADYGFAYFGTQACNKLIKLAEDLANKPYDSEFLSAENKPEPVAFVYGNISNIHNSDDPFHSMSVLKSMPYVICTQPGKLSYTSKKVTDVIKSSTKLFGYVNLGPNNPDASPHRWVIADLDEVKAEIDSIADSGWYGVFIDQYGYDYGETRERQNEIVDYAHSKGLKCMANAWQPDDAMGSAAEKNGNPNGIECHLGAGDWYLIESFLMSNSYYRGDSSYIEKYLKAKQYQDTLGVNILALSYKRDDVTWEQASDDIKLSYILCQCIGYKGWWFGGYSENDAFIHGTDPKIDIGNTFIRYLEHKAGGSYVAETDKYIIEYYADEIPGMVLTPVSGIGPVITIGQRPPSDLIDIDVLTFNQAKLLQSRLNKYGFKDSNGAVLDEDGAFKTMSKSALDSFLKANGFTYFSTEARDLILSENAINVNGGAGTIYPGTDNSY